MALTKHDRIAANPLTVRIILEILCYGGECSGQIDIVAVDKGEDVAGGQFESFVNRVDLPAIFLANPIRQPIFIAANDLDSFIRAAPVDDYVFEVGILLIEDLQHRL